MAQPGTTPVSSELAREEKAGIRPNFLARFWRKQLILPAEHGAWSWWIVPFLVGLALVRPWRLALLPAALVALCLFLLRQPITVFLRVRRGRARPTDGPPALAWLTILLIGLAAGVIWLVLLQRAILWRLLPVVGLLGLLYLLAILRRASAVRTLWLQLVGAGGLAVTAPLAITAANGRLGPWEWGLWAVMAGLNMLGVLYVRVRIADTHTRSADRRLMLLGHLAACLLVGVAGVEGWIPGLVAPAYLALLGRALWLFRTARPVTNVRRFGLSEVGVELLCGLWIVISYGTAI